jgi:sarcosine oxidase subunit gamma
LTRRESGFVHDLQAITPLGGTEVRVDRFDGLTIAENVAWVLASVSARLGQGKPLRAAARKALGFALPEVSRVAGKGSLAAFWTGPDQWFVEEETTGDEDIAGRLRAALGPAASVTEQTGGWARFDVEGPRACDVFERLAALDIRAMAPGMVSRTAIEHLGCFVLARAAPDSFSVFAPRSAAASLHHALLAAAGSAI